MILFELGKKQNQNKNVNALLTKDDRLVHVHSVTEVLLEKILIVATLHLLVYVW